MKIISTILFSMFSLIVCGQKTNATSNYKLYTDNVNGFSVKYPSTWYIRVPDSTEKAKLFIKTPNEGDADKFNENINIIVKKISSGVVNVADIQTSIKKTLLEKMKNYRLLKDKIFEFNGNDAYEIEYAYTKETDGKEIDLITLQRLVFIEGKLITITYISLANSSKVFHEDALSIFETFEFL
jgi:PsbP-like protein